MTSQFKRTVMAGIGRGFAGLCPACGKGKLFSSFLKVTPECRDCGHRLAQYRSDDGPAYFTILIVGHLLIAPLLFSGIVLTWPLYEVLALFLSGLVGVSLVLLPRVKGAFVGVQWAVGDASGV